MVAFKRWRIAAAALCSSSLFQPVIAAEARQDGIVVGARVISACIITIDRVDDTLPDEVDPTDPETSAVAISCADDSRASVRKIPVDQSTAQSTEIEKSEPDTGTDEAKSLIINVIF